MTFDAARFRQVLGQYPTGVAVVTAMSREGEPIGMTVGSFASASLDPPLVTFMPDKRSTSWRALRESGGTFCVNFLSAGQEEVCRSIATRKGNKFDGIAWSLSPGGNPLIDGVVAHADCVTEQIYDVGDHDLVVGRVTELAVKNSHLPLIFFRSGYGSFSPLSMASADGDLLSQMRVVDHIRPALERLASDLATEVSAVCLIGDELVIAATAGHDPEADLPTRVGQRWRSCRPPDRCSPRGARENSRRVG